MRSDLGRSPRGQTRRNAHGAPTVAPFNRSARRSVPVGLLALSRAWRGRRQAKPRLPRPREKLKRLHVGFGRRSTRPSRPHGSEGPPARRLAPRGRGGWGGSGVARGKQRLACAQLDLYPCAHPIPGRSLVPFSVPVCPVALTPPQCLRTRRTRARREVGGMRRRAAGSLSCGDRGRRAGDSLALETSQAERVRARALEVQGKPEGAEKLLADRRPRRRSACLAATRKPPSLPSWGLPAWHKAVLKPVVMIRCSSSAECGQTVVWARNLVAARGGRGGATTYYEGAAGRERYPGSSAEAGKRNGTLQRASPGSDAFEHVAGLHGGASADVRHRISDQRAMEVGIARSAQCQGQSTRRCTRTRRSGGVDISACASARSG